MESEGFPRSASPLRSSVAVPGTYHPATLSSNVDEDSENRKPTNDRVRPVNPVANLGPTRVPHVEHGRLRFGGNPQA